jgi:trigger factor
MAYTVESINGCTKKLIFNYQDVDLSKQITEALKAKQKEANLKGFRKGKAPLAMVQKVYGPQIESDAFYRFVSEEFYKAVKEEKLKAVGYPSFGNTKFDQGKEISFEATVEIFPDFEIKDYSKYSFTKESDAVTAEDYEEVKKNYLASKSEMKEVEDEKVKVATGHFAVFNFEGETKDGEKPENMQAKEFMLEIGSGQFIPGFEDGMIGMTKGQKKTIEVTFPADYHEESLKNAPVKFHVDLLEIKEKKFPELTDELAKEFGFESAADFETKNKERLTVQKKRKVQTKLHQDILDKLIAENKFDIPMALVDQQKKGVQQDLGGNLKSQGFSEDMIGEYYQRWDADITAKAESQVRSGLILDKLAKKYNIEATDADLDEKIVEMVGESGMEKEQIEKYYKSNETIKSNLMYAIREEKTFTQIIKDVKVS